MSPDLTIPLTPFNKALGSWFSLPKHAFIFFLREPSLVGAYARILSQDNVIAGLSRNGDMPGLEFCKNVGNSGLTKSPLLWFCEPNDRNEFLLDGSSSSKRSLLSGGSVSDG